MAAIRGIRRVLRIRELEEEQKRLDLESAMAEAHRLERSHDAALARERLGRSLIVASASTGEAIDRQAGMMESAVACRESQRLKNLIEAAVQQATHARQQFLIKRTEHRQVETLLHEAVAAAEREARHHEQQILDEWHGTRIYGLKSAKEKEWPDI